jgi:hypothetical protein
MPEENQDHLLVDLGPDKPFVPSENVINAITTLQDALFEQDCGVNGIVITVPELSGSAGVAHTDYGLVHISYRRKCR